MCIFKGLSIKEKKCLLIELEGLIGDFDNNQRKIASLFRGLFLDLNFAIHILHADFNRRHRFSMFILLLHESKNLQSDYKLSSEIFKEAYISSDNIYKQINECLYSFSLHGYLSDLFRHGIEGVSLMKPEELGYYNSLPEQIIIYRGCSVSEVKNGVYGISWTDNLDYALKYSSYSKNANNGLGVIIVKKIRKQDIWGIFKHPTDPEFEIIYISTIN